MEIALNLRHFRSSGETFLKQLLAEMTDMGLPVSTLQADHLCFRVETLEQYDSYKLSLQAENILLTESMVNGRPIATFQMKEPFQVQNQKIGLVELPAPKPGSPYQLGFEHAEFVIQESFDVFVSKFPALRFSKSGNKNVNPELCLKTKIGQVKFHHLSLDRVIEIEKSQFRDIIFDLDGTLIQSREAIYEINRIVFSEAQERGVSVEEVKEKFHTEFSKLFEAFGVDCPEKKKNALSKWGQVSGKFSYDLFDGVKSLFTTLSFASMTDSKPHEGSLCFDWNQANLNSVLMLGDSPSDMLGSKNIKAVAAAALWDPYSTEQSMVSSGAELFFHNVSELESWLLEKEVL